MPTLLSRLRKYLCNLFWCHCDCSSKVRWTLNFGRYTVSGEGHMSTMIPDNSTGATVDAQFFDAAGLPATIASSTWQSSDESIFTVAPDATVLTRARIAVASPPKAGLAQLQCIGTNPDGTTATLTGDIQVIGGDATNGSFQVVLDPVAPPAQVKK